MNHSPIAATHFWEHWSSDQSFFNAVGNIDTLIISFYLSCFIEFTVKANLSQQLLQNWFLSPVLRSSFILNFLYEFISLFSSMIHYPIVNINYAVFYRSNLLIWKSVEHKPVLREICIDDLLSLTCLYL